MYSMDENYNYPVVPSHYPMDPCRKKPMPYYHMPMPEHMPYGMPSCPMMDPRFRDCVRVCMMQCGNQPMPYPVPMEYSMDINYTLPQSYETNELNQYYSDEKK